MMTRRECFEAAMNHQTPRCRASRCKLRKDAIIDCNGSAPLMAPGLDEGLLHLSHERAPDLDMRVEPRDPFVRGVVVNRHLVEAAVVLVTSVAPRDERMLAVDDDELAVVALLQARYPNLPARLNRADRERLDVFFLFERLNERVHAAEDLLV